MSTSKRAGVLLKVRIELDRVLSTEAEADAFERQVSADVMEHQWAHAGVTFDPDLRHLVEVSE